MPRRTGYYTTPLSWSWQDVVVGLFIVAVFFGVSYLLREYVYPWLGVPVLGISGFAPFILAWACVLFVLLPFRFFRSREVLTLVVSILAAVVVATLSMLALAPYFAS